LSRVVEAVIAQFMQELGYEQIDVRIGVLFSTGAIASRTAVGVKRPGREADHAQSDVRLRVLGAVPHLLHTP
jgi:hypothetical protein